MFGQDLAHYRQPVKAFFWPKPKNSIVLFQDNTASKKSFDSLNTAISSRLRGIPVNSDDLVKTLLSHAKAQRTPRQNE